MKEEEEGDLFFFVLLVVAGSIDRYRGSLRDQEERSIHKNLSDYINK
jgi:hypothetical protein